MGRITNSKTFYLWDENLDWWEENQGERGAILNEFIRTLIKEPKQAEEAPAKGVSASKVEKKNWHPSLNTAWDYYQEKTGHTRTLTDQRKNKLNARLNELGPETLKRAMDYLLGSPFHNGDNDRKWKWDIDFLIRNTEQVEKFADLYQETPKKKTLAEMFDEQ